VLADMSMSLFDMTNITIEYLYSVLVEIELMKTEEIVVRMPEFNARDEILL
jgi:hypothetical protein